MSAKELIEAMKDGEFRDFFRELVKEFVAETVAEAMAAKDKQIETLSEELEAAKGELEATKDKVNELEQYSRRLCLNVSGIPEGGHHESTNQLVTDAAKMAGVELAPSDIDTSHRIGAPKPGKARVIIVRLTNYTKRQELYNARRELRKPRHFSGSTVTAETASHVFVSDSLTRENQLILYQARQMRKEQKIFAAWSDVGKLKIRISQGGPTHVIRSLRDLTTLTATAAPAETPAAARGVDGEYRRVTRGSKNRPTQ